MNKKTLKLSFIIAGIIAIVLAVIMFAADTGTYVNHETYGGDAYTGIQNAAASTAYNVGVVANIVSNGFAAVLLVIGILLIGIGISVKHENKVEVPAVELPQENIVADSEQVNIPEVESTDDKKETPLYDEISPEENKAEI